MANQPPNSNRSAAAAFTNVSDIGAALVSLTGFPAGTLGFEGPADGYRAYRPGDRLVAKGPLETSEYVVQDNLTQTDVVAVRTFPSSGSPPDIVYVTASPAKYSGMSAFVATTIAAGLLLLPATGGSLVLLDDTYVIAAPISVPDNARLFSFSRTGTLIANGTAGPTIQTQGNAELTNIRLDNGVGEPAIRLVSGGTITLNGCTIGNGAFPVAIDGATNNVSMRLVLNDSEITLGSIAGGATAPASFTGRQSRVRDVVLGASGGIISLTGGRHAALDTPISIVLEECVGSSDIGAAQVPLQITMTNCRLSGGGTIDCGSLTARNVRFSGLYTVNASGAALLQHSDFEDASTLTAGSVSSVDSTVDGGVVTAGTLLGARSSFGPVNAAAINTERCSFTGDVTSSGTFDDTFSNIATGFNVSVATQLDWSFTKCLSKVTVNAQSEFNACYIRVGVAGAGGAIVSNAGTVNLRGGTFVRADDTRFSVSGTGSVSAQGSVNGGCRFDVSAGLVVGQTMDDVRGSAVTGPVALTGGPTALDTLGGSGNEVYTTFDLIGSVALTTVTFYQAAALPVGIEIVLKNSSLTEQYDVVPFAGDTFDVGNVVTHTIPALGFARFRKTTAQNWAIC